MAKAILVCSIAFLGLVCFAEGKFEAFTASAGPHDPILTVIVIPVEELADDGCPEGMRNVSGICITDRCPGRSDDSDSDLTTGEIAWIVVGSTVGVLLLIAVAVIIIVCCWICCKRPGKTWTSNETEMKTIG